MIYPLIAIDPGVKGGIAWNPTLPTSDRLLSPHLQKRSPLCRFYKEPACPRLMALPASSIARIELVRAIVSSEFIPFVLMEDVGYHRAGNSARSSAKLANVVGQLEAAIRCAGKEVYWVDPKQWSRIDPFRLLPKPPRIPVHSTPDFRKKVQSDYSRIRKGLIKRMMAHEYPGVDGLTLNTADALAILHFGLVDPVVQQMAAAKMEVLYGAKR